MKKKLVAVFAIVAVFGLAIAAYAYTQTTFNTTASASCCKDNCPMKNKDAEHGKDHANGEAHKCCGDSCPMKGEHGKTGDHSKMDGHNCCGDSCPMKKKDGETMTTAVSASDEGKNCCDSCDCCKGKAKTETVSVQS
ncbi:MAG: hypothetical protein IPM25_11730 [Chloracidobacterium sp.]|nr:hypothetical protein [Chloracidobacterium sp.]